MGDLERMETEKTNAAPAERMSEGDTRAESGGGCFAVVPPASGCGEFGGGLPKQREAGRVGDTRGTPALESQAHHLRPPDTFPGAADVRAANRRLRERVAALEHENQRAYDFLTRAWDRNSGYIARLAVAYDYVGEFREALETARHFIDGVQEYGALRSEVDVPKLLHAQGVVHAALALPLPPGMVDEEAMAEAVAQVSANQPKRTEQVDPFEGASVHDEDET